MRTGIRVVVLLLSIGASVSAAQERGTGPATAPTLVGGATQAVVAAPGTSLANVDVGTQASIDVAAQAVVCDAPDPNGCPAPPEVTGFADTSTPFNADQLHGRVLLVRNVGAGVLTLKAATTSSLAHWRLSERRVLRPSEVVVLVYDGPQRQWRVVGAK